METKKLVVISAGLRQPSSTRLAADRLAEAVTRALADDGFSVELDVIELRDLAHDITNTMLTGFPPPALKSAIEHVTDADGLIAVTPIFTASYSGLFKSFFDVIDSTALAGKPVVAAATGGSSRHSLALEHAVRPMFTYLHAVVAPTAVYVASEDWGAGGEGDLDLRIGRAAGELSDLMARYSAPHPLPENVVIPFEQQLAASSR